MVRNSFIFFFAFLTGALIALVTRAAMFNPHAGKGGQPEGGGNYPAMVTNVAPAAPLPASAPAPSKAKESAASAADPHAGHSTEMSLAGRKTTTTEPAKTDGPAEARSGEAGTPETSPMATDPAQKPATAPAVASVATEPGKPVNTLCAICGMDVDPKLPTAQYQGKTIAFGCRMCPPKFKADPDKYGPSYLRNEVIKR